MNYYRNGISSGNDGDWAWNWKSITETLGEFAKNKISISSEGDFSSRDENNDKPGGYVQKVTFTKTIVPYIEHYFPELSWRISYQINVPGGTVKIGKKSEEVSAVGVPLTWFELNEKKLEEGGYFTKVHYEDQASVAIINGIFKDTFLKQRIPSGKNLFLIKKNLWLSEFWKKLNLNEEIRYIFQILQQQKEFFIRMLLIVLIFSLILRMIINSEK